MTFSLWLLIGLTVYGVFAARRKPEPQVTAPH